MMIVAFQQKPFVGEFAPDDATPVLIGLFELSLLANAIERDAEKYGWRRGTRGGVQDAARRAAELRREAERRQRLGGAT